MAKVSEFRPSPIAGLWYSGNPQQLSQQIDQYIEQAQLPRLEGEVIAIIAPHAGHRYSGRTAGYAYRCIKDKEYERVVVVSPLHAYAHATVLTSAHQAYATPLGPIWIDKELVQKIDRALVEEGEMPMQAIANDSEHSLEIELPFLQRAITGDFKLIPLMIHSRSAQAAQSLGIALAKVLQNEPSEKKTLLVASTDLSHFYPEAVAYELDSEMLRQIAEFSPEGVIAADHSGKGQACGAAAVAAVLWAAKYLGANSVEILHRSTSGDETGDHHSVVGYGAAVVLKRP